MARLLPLIEATNLVLEKLTHQQLATLLGVSASQVYKYAVGDTTSPKESVVDAFYDNCYAGDDKILIDFYKDEKDYLRYRKMRGVELPDDNL